MIAASILIIDRFILILFFGWSVLLEIREAIFFLANDPKLSDGRAWRGSCVVERRGDILRKNMAWSEDVQARVSSYRDTQNRSLQRTLADSFRRKLEATGKNTWHRDILVQFFPAQRKTVHFDFNLL